MRGGFVACFGRGQSARAEVESLAESLRWHRGAPSSIAVGPLAVAVLADERHGPAIDATHDRLLVVHGSELAPVAALMARGRRFAALEWRDGALIAARDPMGEAPLFYRLTPDAVWFATEIHPLVAVAPSRPDVEALAAEAAFVPFTERTGWKGIVRVPPGSSAVIDPSLRATVSPYWRPEERIAKARTTYDDAVAGVRERFLSAVRSRRSSASAVLLSGGLDSASVAVAAHDGEHTPRLVSIVFPDLPATDETEYARATAAAAGAPISLLTGRTDAWDPAPEGEIFGTPSTLLPTGVLEVAAAALSADGISELLDGHDGDGSFGIYEDLYGALLGFGQVGRLMRLGRRDGWRHTLGSAVRESVPPWARRHAVTARAERSLIAMLMPYYTGFVRARMADDYRWRSPRASWKRFQLLPLTPPTTVVLEQMETEAARFGVDLLHPFADRELLGYLVSLPFSIKVDPDRTKPLLRDAMTGLLPENVRTRLAKVSFNSVLEQRVDLEQCARWVLESGVRLPGIDYEALDAVAATDPAPVTVWGWIRLARAHVFAAAAGAGGRF